MTINGSSLNEVTLNGAPDDGLRLAGGIRASTAFFAGAIFSAVLPLAAEVQAAVGGDIQAALISKGGIERRADLDGQLRYTANLQRGISARTELDARIFLTNALVGGVQAASSVGGQMLGSVSIDASFLRLASMGGGLAADAHLEYGTQTTTRAGAGDYVIDATLHGGVGRSHLLKSSLRRVSSLSGGLASGATLPSNSMKIAVMLGGEILRDATLGGAKRISAMLHGGVSVGRAVFGDMAAFLRAEFRCDASVLGGLNVDASLEGGPEPALTTVGGDLLCAPFLRGGVSGEPLTGSDLQSSPRLSGINTFANQHFSADLTASARLQGSGFSLIAQLDLNPLGIGLSDPFINTRALYLTDHSSHYFLTIAHEDI